MQRPARGISLLEVILALAILAGAVAVLGEVARHTMRNARAVRDSSRAQLLCETKMAEICAALAPLEPVEAAPLAQTDDQGQPEWFYSVAVDSIDQEGMMAVHVTVTHGRSPEGRPLRVSLVRWILDPRAAPAAPLDNIRRAEAVRKTTDASQRLHPSGSDPRPGVGHRGAGGVDRDGGGAASLVSSGTGRGGRGPVGPRPAPSDGR